MRLLFVVLVAQLAASAAFGQSYTISTLAGGAPLPPNNIPGTAAILYGPQSVAVDKTGNAFFVDRNDVLRLDATTGILTLVAGNGTGGFSGDNGPSTGAQLFNAAGIAFDSAGSLYIADSSNNRIRKVSNGVITTVAGNGTAGFGGDNGSATTAQLDYPKGVAVDSGDNLYIADQFNGRIRKVTGGIITTVAGNGAGGFSGDNGPAISAQLDNPVAVAVDSAGNIYIADALNARIREVSNGMIATVAGGGSSLGDNGPATSAQLSQPFGVALDSAANLYIADTGDSRVRKVSGGVISTIAGGGTSGDIGDNGPATSATVSFPLGVAVDSAGNLYIAAGTVRKVSGGTITTAAGGAAWNQGDGGPAISAGLNSPAAVAVDLAGDLFIADTGESRIRKVSKGSITTAAGGGASNPGNNGPATGALLQGPQGVAVDSAGNLFIADTINSLIREVSGGVITAVAGGGSSLGDNGPALSARLNRPGGVAVDSLGNLYIADSYNNRIREVSNGVITTVAGIGTRGYSGDNGPATSAQLSQPGGVAIDSAGNLYIADSDNSRIRKVSSGVITTVAGNGTQGFGGDNGQATSAQLNGAQGVAVDSAGNLYIADGEYGFSTGNNVVRKVSGGVITTIAGNGTPGFSGDKGPAIGAQLDQPSGISVDSVGNLYIADAYNNRIRLLTPGPPVSQTITFGALTGVVTGTAPFTIEATASSGLTVAFVSTTPAVCTVAGATVNIVAAGTCSITASQAGNGAYAAATPVTEGFTVTAASAIAPAIPQGGVVAASSSSTIIQSGSYVTIYGTNLANTTATSTGDFPTMLGGVTVTIDGKSAYLTYVSPTQINLEAPDDTVSGPVNVVVTNSSGSFTSTVTLAPVAPSFLLLDAVHVAGIILRFNGSGAYGGGSYDIIGPTGTSLGYQTAAAKQGDIVELFGVGFGPTDPPVPSGVAFSGAAPTVNPVQLTIGGTIVIPSFAGISSVGLYQINLTIPPGLGTGDQSFVGTVGGVQTQSSAVISLQ